MGITDFFSELISNFSLPEAYADAPAKDDDSKEEGGQEAGDKDEKDEKVEGSDQSEDGSEEGGGEEGDEDEGSGDGEGDGEGEEEEEEEEEEEPEDLKPKFEEREYILLCKGSNTERWSYKLNRVRELALIISPLYPYHSLTIG